MRDASWTMRDAAYAPQPPCAQRVTGSVGASASLPLLDDMFNIASVAPPCICPHGARNGTPRSFSAPC